MEVNLPKSFKNLISKSFNNDKLYIYDESKNEEIIDHTTLSFVRHAGKQFDINDKRVYYIDEEYSEKYIALRWGIFNDCIKVYKLGEKIGIFSGYMLQKPLLLSDENVQKYDCVLENNDLKNRLQYVANVLNIKEDYINKLEKELSIKENDLYCIKEEKREENYEKWKNGKCIYNPVIYEGDD